MGDPLTAHDLMPLILKLTHAERVVLARLALRAAADDVEVAKSYLASPPPSGEFSAEDESLAWEADGWDEFSAPR
jgi:hypothetical protein